MKEIYIFKDHKTNKPIVITLDNENYKDSVVSDAIAWDILKEKHNGTEETHYLDDVQEVKGKDKEQTNSWLLISG